jgi:inhibitor of KinA
MPGYKVLLAGDTGLVVEFGESADLHVSAQVLSLAQRLNGLRLDGLVETVPTARSLMIYYEPLTLTTEALEDRIGQLLQQQEQTEPNGRTWVLPVCYDPALAPDLLDVATRTGHSPAQIIELHNAATYHVYMLGFLPGLAYLGDLPSELALPRRESPRPKIPAGSVGIGGKMTCVYPMDTPCGWHLIGQSPVPLWNQGRTAGALLAPGDKVSFSPISLSEFERLLVLARDNALQIAPVH